MNSCHVNNTASHHLTGEPYGVLEQIHPVYAELGPVMTGNDSPAYMPPPPPPTPMLMHYLPEQQPVFFDYLAEAPLDAAVPPPQQPAVLDYVKSTEADHFGYSDAGFLKTVVPPPMMQPRSQDLVSTYQHFWTAHMLANHKALTQTIEGLRSFIAREIKEVRRCLQTLSGNCPVSNHPIFMVDNTPIKCEQPDWLSLPNPDLVGSSPSTASLVEEKKKTHKRPVRNLIAVEDKKKKKKK